MGEFWWISIILSQVVKFSFSGERSSGFGYNITRIICRPTKGSTGLLTTKDPRSKNFKIVAYFLGQTLIF